MKHQASPQTDYLAALEVLSQHPASNGTTSFCEAVTAAARKALAADCACLLLQDGPGKEGRVRARQGSCDAARASLCQRSLRPARAVALPGSHRQPEGARPAKSFKQLSAPVQVKGERLGVLAVTRAARHGDFTPDERATLHVLAGWTGLALENDRLYQLLHQQYVRVERLLEEIKVAQENERRRVAVEIHDGVAQWMVGASYDIKAAGRRFSSSGLPDMEEELTRIRNTVQRSIRELRRTIANLRPLPLEELGLAEAVRQAASELAADGINCQTRTSGPLPALTPAEEVTIYWVVQEMLNNVRRHSGASQATVEITCHDNTFTLTVSDNGRGFEPPPTLEGSLSLSHLGLLGMKERAELLGGHLSIQSKPGQGTVVSLTLALPAKETANTTA